MNVGNVARGPVRPGDANFGIPLGKQIQEMRLSFPWRLMTSPLRNGATLSRLRQSPRSWSFNGAQNILTPFIAASAGPVPPVACWTSCVRPSMVRSTLCAGMEQLIPARCSATKIRVRTSELVGSSHGKIDQPVSHGKVPVTVLETPSGCSWACGSAATLGNRIRLAIAALDGVGHIRR